MSELPGGDLAICVTCGTQYNSDLSHPPSNCRICEDPRQYVPATGQKWTSLSSTQSTHKNAWKQDPHDARLWSITTSPKLGIGQRAMLLQTAHGNVLWDCIAHLDPATVSWIESIGGLKAIVISHPHFYTTHLDWAAAFECPVYVSALDEEWLCRSDEVGRRRLILGASETAREVLPGVNAVRIGGHFPGQMVLLWDRHLFHADGFVNVPSGFTPEENRVKGMTSFGFMWSIPNMIPLGPEEIWGIWMALKGWEFQATHGLFEGWDLRGGDIKGTLLESMKIQVRRQGFEKHAILGEEWKDRVG